jgi:hypothetical protein
MTRNLTLEVCINARLPAPLPAYMDIQAKYGLHLCFAVEHSPTSRKYH